MEKKTVAIIMEAYEKDFAILKQKDATNRLNKKVDSNTVRLMQRDKMMLDFLKTVPSDLVIDAEGTPADRNKVNAGSLTECILRYHMAKNKPEEISKSGGLFDAKRGCIDVEIKLSLNGSCFNTPIKEKSLLYLVNNEGVFMVKKSEIDVITTNGKLPYKEWDGAERIDWLDKLMFAEVRK
jgi:hypothetical protein